MMRVFIGLFFLFSTTVLHAQGQDVRNPSNDHKKRHKVNFDDTLIEGEVKNPNEFYFVHRPEQKFGKLVKRREQFHKEMLRDVVMMR